MPRQSTHGLSGKITIIQRRDVCRYQFSIRRGSELGAWSRASASSFSGFAVCGRKAIGPRIPCNPSGSLMWGILTPHCFRSVARKHTGDFNAPASKRAALLHRLGGSRSPSNDGRRWLLRQLICGQITCTITPRSCRVRKSARSGPPLETTAIRSSSFLGPCPAPPLLAVCVHAQVPTGTIIGIAAIREEHPYPALMFR